MNNVVFDGEVLAEKLEKLNNSQQSIESVSRWCVFHRKRAKQIVETWDRMFTCSQSDQCVCFLFLANDILQNSRRKGSEFVNEFWSILPSALKHVYENGEEYAKKTVSRLVDIWEERNVFGSRGQGLKNILFGKDPSHLTVLNSRISNPVKIVRKDSHSIRVKLAVGGFPEKILSAFHGVHDGHLNEEAALDKCSFAITSVGKLEEEAQICPGQGSEETALVDELCKWENILHQCIKHLETIEASRTVLLSELQAALQAQEARHEVICNQLHAARGKLEKANDLRQRLESSSVQGSAPVNEPIEVPRILELNSIHSRQPVEVSRIPKSNLSHAHPPTISSQNLVSQPSACLSTSEESKRATVAAIAAKLAASSSSAQMLTSVLSSLVAEEAASKCGGLQVSGFASLPILSQDHKRPKLEKSMLGDSSSDIGLSSHVSPNQHQVAGNSSARGSTSMQTPFPPLPLMPPAAQPANQFVQSAGVMAFGFNGNSSYAPHPLSMISMGLQRSGLQPPLQMPQQQQQQQAGPVGYYRPPGIGFYGQNHQPTTPPVPRQ